MYCFLYSRTAGRGEDMSILPRSIKFKRKGIKMHKEKDYNNRERKFMDSINKEYNAFKNSMLLKEPQEIYDSYGEIYFYECMYEYFQYNENTDSRFINIAYDTKNIIAKLKYIYESKEYFTINTWSGIDNIVDCYI